jgi:hypothetical protein
MNRKEYAKNYRDTHKEEMRKYREVHHVEQWISRYVYDHKGVSKEVLLDMVNNTKTCPICGWELDYGMKGTTGPRRNSPTIENRKGVLQIVCNECSKIKVRPEGVS